MSEDLLPEDEHSAPDELFEHFRIIADRGQSQVRLDKYLQQRIQNASRTKIQYAADAGNILVNGKVVRSSYQVKPGDEILILLAYPPRETEVLPENIPLDIVYEDEQVLVVNKAAGMVVHPAYGNFTGTLVNALAWHLKDLPLFKEKGIRPGLVHRIDKNTSGLLLIAKDELSLNRLARQFFDHKAERKYLALVWGNFDNDQGTITGNIGRSIRDRKKMDVFPDGKTGKHAVTHYSVLERFGYVSLVECQLETGRTHQIRVHFQHIKHPLFNDEEYGGSVILRGTTSSHYKQFINNCFEILPRHALHARSLGFTHPVTGRNMYFEAPLPGDMIKLIERWRNYIEARQS
jgi:23S rRNA pseudouridine1911/1915/1917 synthase